MTMQLAKTPWIGFLASCFWYAGNRGGYPSIARGPGPNGVLAAAAVAAILAETVLSAVRHAEIIAQRVCEAFWLVDSRGRQRLNRRRRYFCRRELAPAAAADDQGAALCVGGIDQCRCFA